MTTRFNPGDVVRLKSDGLEMTVDQARNDGQVRCVWFTGAGITDANWFNAPTLELVRNAEREKVWFNPGDVVRLPSGGPAMTVDQGGKSEIRCVWFNTLVMLAEKFDARLLEMVTKTEDAKVRVNPGDVVRLRSGGPVMTVDQGGDGQVRCVYGTHGADSFDARTLEVVEKAAPRQPAPAKDRGKQ